VDVISNRTELSELQVFKNVLKQRNLWNTLSFRHTSTWRCTLSGTRDMRTEFSGWKSVSRTGPGINRIKAVWAVAMLTGSSALIRSCCVCELFRMLYWTADIGYFSVLNNTSRLICLQVTVLKAQYEKYPRDITVLFFWKLFVNFYFRLTVAQVLLRNKQTTNVVGTSFLARIFY
jgi:hypothetical protein